MFLHLLLCLVASLAVFTLQGCGSGQTKPSTTGSGNCGAGADSCAGSISLGSNATDGNTLKSFKVRSEWSEDGVWTTYIAGQKIDLHPRPNHEATNFVAATLREVGAVFQSSQWSGWVPVQACGIVGDLHTSTFSIKNLKIKGEVVQGPTPRNCSSENEQNSSLWCPSADDLDIDYKDDDGHTSLFDRGWTISGRARVYSKASFNVLGGFVEFDMDVSKAGVNGNLYLISPDLGGSPYDGSNYCDGHGNVDGTWCSEQDVIQVKGNCGAQTTLVTRQDPKYLIT